MNNGEIEVNKKIVLVLGGGLGAMSAAHALTETSARRAAFDVTVATEGWRLGGKGASGRRAGAHQRIEEHGLHIFLGFYRTAFATMHEALSALDGAADGVFATVDAAFRPDRQVTLWIDPGDGAGGEWAHYTLTAPEWPGMPWDPAESVGEMLRRAPYRLLDVLHRHGEKAIAAELGRSPHEGRLADRFARLRGCLPGPGTPSGPVAGLGAEIGHLLAELRQGARGVLDDLRIGVHLVYDLIEIGTAILHGYFTQVFPHGPDRFDVIDDRDFRAWLVDNGCSESASWSEGVRVIYDLAFAYEGGRTTKAAASIAAGAALRLVLQMAAGYSHAPLWRMNAGMGDTIFTPLHKLFVRRGGRVLFFHRVAEVEADPATGLVEAVTLVRQARLANGAYDPFVRVHGLDCWPSEPDWTQLVGGAQMQQDGVDFEDPWCPQEVDRVTLRRGVDFDHVILGIPPAAAGPLTPSLAAMSPDWQRMIDSLAGSSVATHSVQLWLDRTTAGLDWAAAQADPAALTVSGAYVPPLGTWADMSHLIAQEAWAGADPARSCQYLVGVVELPMNVPPPGDPAPHYQQGANQLFAQQTLGWLDAAAFRLWPGAGAAGGFEQARVVGRHDHVNIAPTELYVRTPPGSVADRLPPDWDGIANLWLAGDWTTSSINGGSAEAACESGRAAALGLIRAEGVEPV